jgi:FAD/FMN-containing dehydrogenase
MAKVTKTHDATISNHHGVGILKRRYAREEMPRELARKLKQALDPEKILSPDKFI